MIPLRQIGDTLIELQLLSAAQWQLATAGEPDLVQTLDRLERLPGTWYDPDNPDARALTEFQRDVVFASGRKNRLELLDRRLRLGRFLIVTTLGRGGMGTVLLGWDLLRRRYVALKRVHSGSPQKRRRFRREARISSRLNHPSICRSLGFQRLGRAAVLVMEYIPGRSLKAEVAARQTSISWQETAQWAVEVLDGLAHAHGRGVIHRDIKPENIILTPSGRGLRAKILDMGLAKLKDSTDSASSAEDLTQAGQLVGTPAYMAPELWKGSGQAVPESDVYALGGTLFLALTGRPPFREDSPVDYSTAHGQQRPPRLMEFRPDAPPRLDDLIGRMLSKQPRQRGTALELLWEFRRLLGAAENPAESRSPSPRPLAAVRAPETKLQPGDLTLAVTALSAGRVAEPARQPVESVAVEPAAPRGPEIVFREVVDGEQSTYRFAKPTRLKFHNQTIARLIPVPGRWSVYPTGLEPLVWRNRVPVRGRCRLVVGDVVRLENREWRVDELAAMPAATWSPPEESPSIEVWFGGRPVGRVAARAETLIGTADWCDLQLPAGFGLPPHWAVLANTSRGWELFSLGEWVFSRDDEILGTDVAFDGPDEVQEGDLRLVFHPGTAATEPTDSLADTGTLSGTADLPPGGKNNPFYRRCDRLCQKTVDGLREDPTPTKAVGKSFGLKRLLKRLAWTKEPAEELRGFEMDLEQAPHDTALVRKLGEFFARFGFDNLYGRLLIELYKREPHDAQLLVDLAEVYSRRAMQPDRPLESRIHSAGEAYACLQQAQKLRPGDLDLYARLKHAAGQMTLLKGGFGGAGEGVAGRGRT